MRHDDSLTDANWSPVDDDQTALQVRRHSTPRRQRIGLQLSERKLLLGVMDVICVNAALAVATGWRFGRPPWSGLALEPIWYGVLTSVWLIAALVLDSYDLRRAARLKAGAATGVVTSLATALAYLLIPYVTPPLPASRSSLLVFLTAMVVPVTAWRAFYAIALVGPALRRRALVVGAGWAGRTIVEAVRQHAPAEYDLVGFVDDDPDKQGQIVAGLQVLGGRRDLLALLKRTGATEVIVAVTEPGRIHPELFQAILDCHEGGLQVTQMAVLFEQLTGRVPVEHAGRNLYVVLPLNGFPSRLHSAVKRLLDLGVGLAGAALTIVFAPLIWLAHRLESPGPLFYSQERVGRGGRAFRLVKFRTMIPDAEVEGPRWAEEDDRRVTRVGRWLRRLHLDELPQAINILRGDMSFIGPRPERPEFVAHLEQQIPFYRARHAVRPGVTGWAQVNYEYGDSVEDALIKLQYDLYYIKHANLWLDLVILARTVGHVLRFAGR